MIALVLEFLKETLKAPVMTCDDVMRYFEKS